MKIALLGNDTHTFIKFRGDLVRELSQRGHEIFACTPKASSEQVLQLNALGAGHLPAPLSRTGMNPLADFMYLLRLCHIFRKIKVDLLFCYTIKPVVFGSLAAKITGVPRTFSMIAGLGYTLAPESKVNPLLRRLAQSLYRVALYFNEKVFFQNPDDRQVFIDNRILRHSSMGVVVNGSGVNLDYYRAVPVPEGNVIFLLIARLLRDKGIIEYIEAAKLVKARYPETVFNLLGPFDSNPSSIAPEQINKWHNEGVIRYLGEVEDVRQHLSECSVFVLPSYFEGTPRTVLEAMALGRPVITTTVPGCKETVVDGVNGFLVQARDSEALADAMEKCILSPDHLQMMGSLGRRMAEEKYDVKLVNGQILITMGIIK